MRVSSASCCARQLAYQKQFGKLANVYEAASTAGFRHGRTETLRCLTPEMVSLVQFLLKSSATGAPLSDDAKARARALFEEAKKRHSQLVREAVTGICVLFCSLAFIQCMNTCFAIA